MKRIDYLIKYLETEYDTDNLRYEKKPKTKLEKKNYLRGLCNVRFPAPIGKDFLEQESIFLQEELKKRKIVDSEKIKCDDNKIAIWKGDITTLKIDAIVNAANSQGLGCFVSCHNCIDNQIHSWAGIQMRCECGEIMDSIGGYLDTGKAFITKGYNLPAKYVIHTVGPIISDKVKDEDRKLLSECYINSLELAKENNVRTIAFPCISTGVFMFPLREATYVAIKTVKDYLKDNSNYFDKIIFNVYTENDLEVYNEIYN